MPITKLSFQSCALALCAFLLSTLTPVRAQLDACLLDGNGGFSIQVDTIATNIGPITNILGTTTDLTGYNCYRLYLSCEGSTDLLQAVFGDAANPTSINTSTAFYQAPAGGTYSYGVSPALLPVYPEVGYDSWLTIGMEGPANTTAGEIEIQVTEDNASLPISGSFALGGNLNIDSPTGSTWYVTDAENATNCSAGSDLKVLFAQLTTDGALAGNVNFQVYRDGVQEGTNCIQPNLLIDPSTLPGCTDEAACNFDPQASVDDDSCDYCSCADTTVYQSLSFPNDTMPEYSLEIDIYADHDTTGIEALDGLKTYRFYVRLAENSDRLSSVYGNQLIPLEFDVSSTFYQSALGTHLPSSPSFWSLFPETEFDSFVTIGIDRIATAAGPGFQDTQAIQDTSSPWISTFDPGSGNPGSGFLVNNAVGGSWFVLPSSANGIPDENQRVLIGQFTTDGIISGSLGIQVLPEVPPSYANDYRLRFDFTTELLGVDIISNYPEDLCGCISDVDEDGLCDSQDGCFDLTACNYADTAATACLTLDALGVCGGACAEDLDGNGVCDSAEVLGCTDETADNYDPGANVDDGSCIIAGCTDPLADNYNPNATNDDGSCLFEGCTDPEASNYDETALDDDGSCTYPGCTDPDAWNYDAGANLDDGSCQANACGVEGTLVLATSFDFAPAIVTIPTGGTVVWQNMSDGALHNVNGDVDSQTGLPFGNPQAFMLMSVAGTTQGSCMGNFTFTVPGVYQYDCSIGNHAELGMTGTIFVGTGGCTDPTAANYNPAADYDNGICLYWGCTDQTACNYDPEADVPNGSCVFADGPCEACDGGGVVELDADGDGVCDGDETTGCTDALACNYDSTSTTDTDNTLCQYPETDCATCSGEQDGTGTVIANDDDGDGICNNDEVAGCTDSLACNFNENATDDDGSCVLADGNCEICFGDSVVVLDSDGDGICNNDEIAGCTDATACNFDATATDDDGSCTFTDGICDTCVDGIVVDNDTDNDGICDADEVAGCTDSLACNFNPAFTDDDGSCVYLELPCETCENGSIITNDDDGDGVCNADEIIGCQDSTACNYNELATDAGDCTFTDGICQTCEEGLIVDNDDDGDGVCNADEVIGCQDVSACNFDSLATDSDSTLCVFALQDCESCLDGGVILNDADGDGVCDSDEIVGCTDSTACNFNGAATDSDSTLCTFVDGLCDTCVDGEVVDNDADDDGICDADEIPGCTDALACNYDSLATDDDGNCAFAEFPCESCEDLVVVLNDADGDGVCDPDEILGCTDPFACNYDSTSTTDTDNTLCAYLETACATCSGEQDGTGTVIANDDDGDGVCNADEIPGCTDALACNFDTLATDDDDSCEYLDALDVCGGLCPSDMDNDGICDDDDACIGQYDALGVCNGTCPADIDGDGVCDNAEIFGCTDPLACNYDSLATEEDDSCLALDALDVCGGDCAEDADADGICDDVDECVGTLDALDVCNGDCAADVDGDGVCDTDEIPGCTDPLACNFDSLATDDDGSCAQLDAIDVCGGDCEADEDGDGICDDVDPCVGQFDALGDCNGGCAADLDNDEICDDEDPCVGQYDALGICNGGCPSDFDNDGVCDNAEILGCTDTTACNFNPLATEEDGSCQQLDALNECGGTCSADDDGDGICDDVDDCVGELDVLGICNGGCEADTDGDGICDTDEVAGCTDENACNYNPNATDDDGSCTAEDAIGECGGSCSCDQNANGICDDDELACPDFNGNGICDGDEVFGCTYADACNYDELATADDGTCFYAVPGFDCEGNNIDADELFYGCTYEEAINYSAAADLDNGSCVFLNVITGIGPCYFDVTDDGIVNTPDLLILLQYWEATCVE